MEDVAVAVPATTANLGPGFDALGAALTLSLVVRATPFDGLRIRASGEGAGDVPADEENLVWAACRRACEEFGAPAPDVTLRVHNDIPLARGLGSSSAAIVGGIAIARAMLDAAVPDHAVAELATDIEGHPDNVVPAVFGGLTACAVDPGGRLVVRRVQPSPRLRPLVLVPAVTQSTSEARAVLPDVLERGAVAQQAARAAHVTGALLGAWPVDVGLTGDLLHEPPRLRVMGTTGEVVAALREAGVHAWLSGAGPTVACVVPRRDGRLPDEALRRADELGFALVAVDWDLRGTYACRAGRCAISGRSDCWQCPRKAV